MSEAPVRTEDQRTAPEALKLSEMLERGLIPGMTSADLPTLRKWSTRYRDFPQPIGWRAPANLYSLAAVITYVQKRRGKGAAEVIPIPAPAPDVEVIPPVPDVSDSPPGCEPGGEWLSLAEYGFSNYEVWSRGGQGRDQQPIRSLPRTINGRYRSGMLLKVGEGSRNRPGGPPRAKGYLRVKPYPDEGIPRPIEVHALILLANVGRPEPGMETRHLDSDPHNNRWEPGDEKTTRKAGGNLIYGTAKQNHNDQVKAGTAFHPPVVKCANHARCGGTAVKDGNRCLPCMTRAAEDAASLLRQGMHRSDVAVELGYAATSGPYVEGLAVSLGGYVKSSSQAAPKRRAPKRTLRQRVTGWFRRKDGR